MPTNRAVTLDDYATLAGRRLDPAVQAYIDGGAGDEHTLAANRADWTALRLWPRVLQNLPPGDTRCQLNGRTMAHPIWLAPVAYQRLAHPDGELATAMAAAAQEAGMVLSCQSSIEVEAVAQAMAGTPEAGPLWFQLHPQPDAGLTRALAQRAEAAGCAALVLTVDAPLHGVRDRELRAAFRLPAGVRAAHLPQGMASHERIDALLTQACTWDDLAALRAATGLPLWLKGVLHPDDARTAAELGVAGLIVSNHGGRTLDTAVSTAWALGAQGVLVGRPQLHALAAEGALGVARMLRLLRDELQVAMALCGCARLADISPALLAPR